MFSFRFRLLAVSLLVFGLLVQPVLTGDDAAAQDVTLRVLLPIGGGYTSEDQKKIGEEFERVNPDIDVEMEFVGWANLFDRIVTSIGAGNAPDVMYIGSRWIPQLSNMGAIVPLDDYIDAEKRDMYPETVWNTVTYNGKRWGVVRAMSAKALVYNKDLFRRAGLDPEDPPETWDELHHAAEEIDRLGDDIHGYGLAGKKFISTTSQFLNFLFANGGRVVNEEGKVVLDRPEAVQAMEFYAQLRDVSQPSPLEWQREDFIKLFTSGNLGMYIDHVFAPKQALEQNVDVGVALIPGGPAKNAPRHASIQVTDSIAIPSQTPPEKREAAWKFIQYMTSFEKQAEWDKMLGFIPPIKKEMELDAFQRWYWRPYRIAIRKYAVPQPKLKNFTAGSDIIINAIQKVLLDRASPRDALSAAAASLRSIEGQ